MAKASVEVLNLARLSRKLEALRVAYRVATGREIKVALVNMQNGARRRARVRHGRMRNSITHEQAPDGLSGRVGSNLDYIIYHEFGTRYMSAQPMLNPAAQEEFPQFRARLKRALERAAQKVAAGK